MVGSSIFKEDLLFRLVDTDCTIHTESACKLHGAIMTQRTLAAHQMMAKILFDEYILSFCVEQFNFGVLV